jgi:hypothetical protein
MELTLKERQKLTRLTATNYRKAKKRGKSAVLDTFIAQTGHERKYAIHLLSRERKRQLRSRRGCACRSPMPADG